MPAYITRLQQEASAFKPAFRKQLRHFVLLLFIKAEGLFKKSGQLFYMGIIFLQGNSKIYNVKGYLLTFKKLRVMPVDDGFFLVS